MSRSGSLRPIALEDLYHAFIGGSGGYVLCEQKDGEMATLIKNGTLITATETFEADILIEGEKISLIGKDLQHPNAEVIDATGKLIMPGGIDPHVHLDLPMFGTVSSDDHYTGHKAAAFGGTTTVMDFVVLEHSRVSAFG